MRIIDGSTLSEMRDDTAPEYCLQAVQGTCDITLPCCQLSSKSRMGCDDLKKGAYDDPLEGFVGVLFETIRADSQSGMKIH